MATRNDHDNYDWALSRDRRLAGARHGNEDDYAPPPPLKDTLIELAVTVAGFVGIILVICAVLGALHPERILP